MHLCDRYRQRTPMGYGVRAYFEIGGVPIWGISGFIDVVLNRYARRFGPVRQRKAHKLRERLAGKYTNCNRGLRAVLGAWRDDEWQLNSYPTDIAWAHRDQSWQALSECLNEGRDYTPTENFDDERKKYSVSQAKAFDKHWIKVWEDEQNLKTCRRLIRQIQEQFREGSKDNRSVA